MSLKPLVIISAWMQVFKGVTTQEHTNRAKICNGCLYATYKAYTDFIDDDLKEVKGFICGVCNCPLIAKIRSTDNCPKNKW